MSSRTAIQQVIDTNVYDNTNKEILASMLRTVFEELMNSNFNKTDDQLMTMRYNASQTLAEYLTAIPVIRHSRVGFFDPGSETNKTLTITGSNVITAATYQYTSGTSGKIVLTFSENISARHFIFSIETGRIGDTALRYDSTICMPAWRIDTPTQISIGLFEGVRETQELYLHITIL